MSNLRMIAIPMKVADLVRTTLKSPGYGHPAHKEIAVDMGRAGFACALFGWGTRSACCLRTIRSMKWLHIHYRGPFLYMPKAARATSSIIRFPKICVLMH